MANVKSATWKDAVGFFLIMVALRGGSNLITKHGESPLYILGWSALPAVPFYIFKRKDWYDERHRQVLNVATAHRSRCVASKNEH
jgi:hypothetical protein